MMYRVFLGAPAAADVDKDPSAFHWHTLSSSTHAPKPTLSRSESIVFPAATLEAASRRISLIYQNVIFDEGDEEEEEEEGHDGGVGGQDQTTLITWPPTALDESRAVGQNTGAPSFLLDISKSHLRTQEETQESFSGYNDYSDSSSIARFPSFTFSLHALTSLSSLSSSSSSRTKKPKISALLLAALEVDGPDTIRLKRGVDAGTEVCVLNMILGDEDGYVCKLTAWREVAETWGGLHDTVAVKRGDVLLIENVTATCDPGTSPALSASPYLKSTAQICFRTMPYTHEDNRLRPDLRLGESDAAVRKVAAVVRWFEGMAGLPGAS